MTKEKEVVVEEVKVQEELNLVQRLIMVQKELKAPKGQYNSFGKYNYRSMEDIVEAVKPLNAKYGLLLFLNDTVELVGDRYYIKATATITDGNDQYTVSAYAREPLTKKGMDDSQISGTASSYARKYALNGLYLIDDTKDADTDEHTKTVNRSGSKSKPSVKSDGLSAEEKNELYKYVISLGADKDAAIEFVNKQANSTFALNQIKAYANKTFAK